MMETFSRAFIVLTCFLFARYNGISLEISVRDIIFSFTFPVTYITDVVFYHHSPL